MREGCREGQRAAETGGGLAGEQYVYSFLKAPSGEEHPLTHHVQWPGQCFHHVKLECKVEAIPAPLNLKKIGSKKARQNF